MGSNEIGQADGVVEPADPQRRQPQQVKNGLPHADVGVPAAVDAGLDPASEHEQRHPRAVRQLHPIGGVLDVRRDHVVVPAAPVIPGQQAHGVVPVAGLDDRVHGLPDLVLAFAHISRRVLVIRAVVPDHGQVRQGGGVGDDLVAAHDVRRAAQLLVERHRVGRGPGIGLPCQPVVSGLTEDGGHVPHRLGLAAGRVPQRGRLAADEKQMVRGRVGAEPRAVVLEERAGGGQVGVVGQHGGVVELGVGRRAGRAGLLGMQPLGVCGPVVGLVLGRRVGLHGPPGRDVGAPCPHRPEVVVRRVVLLNEYHDVSHRRHHRASLHHTGSVGQANVRRTARGFSRAVCAAW